MFCRCKPLWDLLRIFPNTLCRAHVRWEWGSPWVTHSATAPDGNVSVTLFFYSKLVLVGGKIKQTHTQQQHFRFHPCRANNRRQHSSTARQLRRRQGTARGDRSGVPGWPTGTEPLGGHGESQGLIEIGDAQVRGCRETSAGAPTALGVQLLLVEATSTLSPLPVQRIHPIYTHTDCV